MPTTAAPRRHDAADLRALCELVEAGALTPLIDRAYPLADAAAALRRLLSGQAVGSVVLPIDQTPPDHQLEGARHD